jgi:AsmA-like protein
LSRKVLRGILITVVVIALLVTATSIALTIAMRGYVKERLVEVLTERFHSEVKIDSLTIIIFPRVYVSAHGVMLRYKNAADLPPLMQVEKLTVGASISGLLANPKRISSVHLEGMQIHVPPKSLTPTEKVKSAEPKKPIPVIIDEVTADNSLLETLPRDPKKLPRDFNIHHVVLTDFGFDQASPFHATLTNPKPLGEIDSSGQFGPWNTDEPSDTPVTGTFRFSNADMSTLKGLQGILSSNGKYEGVLDTLNVEGDTDTPDFALHKAGNPVDLKTHYIAIVDGTNGDTYLTSVVSHFAHSTVIAKGQVVGITGIPGKHILLDTVATNARVEDMIHLVVKGDTPMTGTVNMRAKIDIPPRPGEDVFDRLSLNGKFGVTEAHFSSDSVQGKIDSLSRRGQGQPKNGEIADVISNLRGDFILKDRMATFSDLSFDVEGAAITLSGVYDLDKETLDFSGHLILNAKLSQTTTGAKSFFLKAVDPFFKNKRGAGTDLPIKITGSRSSPSFGLDLHNKNGKKDKDEKAPGTDKNSR